MKYQQYQTLKMPNYRPQRENGACFGSLWKQHVKPSSSPSLVYISKVDKAASREALAVNERAKSHDFCVLAGNILAGYESFSAFRRGDHPTVSSIPILLYIFIPVPILIPTIISISPPCPHSTD